MTQRNVFEYEAIAARLVLNTRIEKHGKENEGACTLILSLECPNTILNYLTPGLCSALYGGDIDPQANLDSEYLPSVRFPKLGGSRGLDWDLECTDHLVEILGPGGRHPIALPGCELKGFIFECKEGGTVQLSFKVNCHPEPKMLPSLYKHTGKDVELKITAEEPRVEPEQVELVEE